MRSQPNLTRLIFPYWKHHGNLIGVGLFLWIGSQRLYASWTSFQKNIWKRKIGPGPMENGRSRVYINIHLFIYTYIYMIMYIYTSHHDSIMLISCFTSIILVGVWFPYQICTKKITIGTSYGEKASEKYVALRSVSAVCYFSSFFCKEKNLYIYN